MQLIPSFSQGQIMSELKLPVNLCQTEIIGDVVFVGMYENLFQEDDCRASQLC